MTGRLPIRTGCAGDGPLGGVFNADSTGGLPLNETTLADMARSQGYKTVAIGKWHLGQREQFLPASRGFDEYYGVPYSDDMGPTPWDNYNSKDRPPLPLLQQAGEGNTTIVEQPTDLAKLTRRYTTYAADFFKRMAAAPTGDEAGSTTGGTGGAQPWLMYFAFNHVHVPSFCSEEDGHCGVSKRGRFGDAAQELDWGVGEIMDALKANGFDDDGETITFFTCTLCVGSLNARRCLVVCRDRGSRLQGMIPDALCAQLYDRGGVWGVVTISRCRSLSPLLPLLPCTFPTHRRIPRYPTSALLLLTHLLPLPSPLSPRIHPHPHPPQRTTGHG